MNRVAKTGGAAGGAGLVLALSIYGVGEVEKWEGMRLEAYADPATKGEPYTICVGATGKIYYDGKVDYVRPGLKLTLDQCHQVTQHIADTYRAGLETCVTRQLNQNQSDALISFAINIGVAGTCKGSVIRYVNQGDFKRAGESMLLYSCAPTKDPKYPQAHCGPYRRQMPGLLSRRKFEAWLLNLPLSPFRRSIVDTMAIANSKRLEDVK